MKRAEWLAVACPDCEAPAGTECWSAIRRGRQLASGCHPDRRRVVLGTYVENHDRALRRMVDEIRTRVVRKHLEKDKPPMAAILPSGAEHTHDWQLQVLRQHSPELVCAQCGETARCACCRETIRNQYNTGFRCSCRWSTANLSWRCDEHQNVLP